MTSEDPEALTAMLEGTEHQYISFEGKMNSAAGFLSGSSSTHKGTSSVSLFTVTNLLQWNFCRFQNGCILLKIMVRERGFEPPTPWSRTKFQNLLKLVEIDSLYVIDMEPAASR